MMKFNTFFNELYATRKRQRQYDSKRQHGERSPSTFTTTTGTKVTPIDKSDLIPDRIYATYQLDNGISLSIVHGLVVNFGSTVVGSASHLGNVTCNDGDHQMKVENVEDKSVCSIGAIVNATNRTCCTDGGGLGVGYVDRMISHAGGKILKKDRHDLPYIHDNTKHIRCPTGQVRLTGPPSNGSIYYGSLHVAYIIHAVGPNYAQYGPTYKQPDKLLRHCYHDTLDICCQCGITHVALPSLLCCGKYRGRRNTKDILRIGVTEISQWALNNCNHDTEGDDSSHHQIPLRSVYIYAYKMEEVEMLIEIANELDLRRIV